MLKLNAAFPSASFMPKAPLIKAPPLVSEYCGLPNLRIKDCSRTATGTMKDFRSVELIRHMEGFYDFVLVYQITYGNAGYSMGYFCDLYNRLAGRKKFYAVNIVDKNLDEGIKTRLKMASEVIEVRLGEKVLSPKEIEEIAFSSASYCEISRQKEGSAFLVDPELFGALFPRSGLYRRLVLEVAKAKADLVMMPIGSGELYFNFLTFHPFGPALMHNPHIENRIRGACVAGNAFIRTAGNAFIRTDFPSKIAEKLVTPISYFRHMSAIMSIVGDADIMEAHKILSQAGINAEPSAATAFAALKGLRFSRQDARVIVINTGCGLYGPLSP